MAVVLALLSALAYGISDFCGGLASRRFAPEPAVGVVTAVGLVFAAVGVAAYGGHGARPGAVAWGAISGIGSGVGTLALYRGLAAGKMAITGTVSAVLAAVLPVIVGLALGDTLSAPAAIGVAAAVPAIALVSWSPGADAAAPGRAAVGYGGLAGLGFALLFVGLHRAGTGSGAWPLLCGQAVALAVVGPGALRASAHARRPDARELSLAVTAGILAGTATLLFLLAGGHGELSIVAVIASLYPAFTILLARAILREHWTRVQAVGLLAAAASVVLVSVS